jgi:hypothetical protein
VLPIFKIIVNPTEERLIPMKSEAILMRVLRESLRIILAVA